MSTIDPGCEEQVKASAQNVDDPEGHGAGIAFEKEHEEEDADFKDPSSWWFASTACPLLAGTFGPMANGFSICALVYNWRVYLPPGVTEEHGERVTDPHWLIAVNAVSLLFAVLGNATLLLNMSKRLRFSIAQPVTITGFLMAGVLLIADMAVLTASPTYYITDPKAIPDSSHALTSAFYYAAFASGLYIMIGLLMCLTVYGANRGYYDKDFNLTPSQRTLMLQTMSFIAYLLLGALVFSSIEDWNYLDGVYWANVTLLTVGLGDFSPTKNVSMGLLFPFAIGGILMVGLVVGSIRSLVLERGREKMSAPIIEKRRETAVHNVDKHKQTIKISWFARAEFSTHPSLTPAQRREEEFNVMRKVQAAAERERRYFSLGMSSIFALLLWFVGAVIFKRAEYLQGWTYLQALYFTFTSLLTIGYGDYAPNSTFGRAFFVLWSLLAVPSLTILISNMGDTIVKWFSDITVWIGSITVLPGEAGVRVEVKRFMQHFMHRSKRTVSKFTPPGLLGDIPSSEPQNQKDGAAHAQLILDQLADRLLEHLEEEELWEANDSTDELQRDTHFYHYVLAREIRSVQKDHSAVPPKMYSWADWEYYLKLMGNEDDPKDYPGQNLPNRLAPAPLLVPGSIYPDHVTAPISSTGGGDDSDATLDPPRTLDGVVDRETEVREMKELEQREASSSQPQNPAGKMHQMLPHHRKHSNRHVSLNDWSWLSDRSPLMSSKSEADWILERLSAALERELDRQRRGYRRRPPIGVKDAGRAGAAASSPSSSAEGGEKVEKGAKRVSGRRSGSSRRGR